MTCREVLLRISVTSSRYFVKSPPIFSLSELVSVWRKVGINCFYSSSGTLSKSHIHNLSLIFWKKLKVNPNHTNLTERKLRKMLLKPTHPIPNPREIEQNQPNPWKTILFTLCRDTNPFPWSLFKVTLDQLSNLVFYRIQVFLSKYRLTYRA